MQEPRMSWRPVGYQTLEKSDCFLSEIVIAPVVATSQAEETYGEEPHKQTMHVSDYLEADYPSSVVKIGD